MELQTHYVGWHLNRDISFSPSLSITSYRPQTLRFLRQVRDLHRQSNLDAVLQNFAADTDMIARIEQVRVCRGVCVCVSVSVSV